MTIPNAYEKVPMMFRAQTDGRCQLHYPQRYEEPHVLRWADEWIERTYPDTPKFVEGVRSRTYKINWRFLTDGGQDDSIIRPSIGARGWPFITGSSMKGLFRRACSQKQRDRYCGSPTNSSDPKPGILRFHGGYPTDTSWTENLVDIVHPQQTWQVKSDRKEGGAFALISLHEPEICFGLSSTMPLSDSEWQTIWEIWERAIATGIGGRVSAGYGQPRSHKADELYRCNLKGQGQAPKLFDGTGEFRPNIFRAGIRGHALRIFGGLTTSSIAEQAVQDLFGGVQGGATVGLLSTTFRPASPDSNPISYIGEGNYEQPVYRIEGELSWSLTRPLSDDQRIALTKLIEALTRFAMVFGGFGKSWRRADHRLFLPDYYDQRGLLIGCHWHWVGQRSLLRDVKIRKPDKVGSFIDEVRQIAADWLTIRGFTRSEKYADKWRETWHPDTVQVWGRPPLDKNHHPLTAEQCEAIRWFHGAYRKALPQARIPEGTIYKSSFAGKVERNNSSVGRIWHRMYPFINRKKDEEGRSKPIETPAYFEFLTIFPDETPECGEFLDFLESEQRMFQKLWPAPVG